MHRREGGDADLDLRKASKGKGGQEEGPLEELRKTPTERLQSAKKLDPIFNKQSADSKKLFETLKRKESKENSVISKFSKYSKMSKGSKRLSKRESKLYRPSELEIKLIDQMVEKVAMASPRSTKPSMR